MHLYNLICKKSSNNFLIPIRQKAVISSSIQFLTITQAASAEKIQRIVNDISQLTLIEVAELNQVLKTTLKIPDAPVMAYGAGPAAGPAQPKEVIILNFFIHLIKLNLYFLFFYYRRKKKPPRLRLRPFLQSNSLNLMKPRKLLWSKKLKILLREWTLFK